MVKSASLLAAALLLAGASGVQLGSRVGASARRFAPRHIRAEPDTAASPASTPPPDDGLTDKQREMKRLREAEVFMIKDTGRYECRTCSYVYDPAKGDGMRECSSIMRHLPAAITSHVQASKEPIAD